MTAKPQPMAGQSEAPDDLIAELAKLMAQDARSTPAKPALPTFTVRIPGEPAATPSRGEPVRSPEAPAIQHPTSPLPRATEPAQAAQVPTQGTSPDPFRFSFDLGEQPKPVASKPAEVSAPVMSDAPQADIATDHDSIADLIAAELAMDSSPAPRPAQSSAPDVTAEPVFAEKPADPVVSRPAPAPNANWNPVDLPANPNGQNRPAPAQLRRVDLQPAPRSERDQFKVPPVFGLGTTAAPTPSEPRSRDPVRTEPSISSTTSDPSFTQAAARPGQTPEAIAPIVMPALNTSADDNIGLDPIDEIESLIGRAVRVDLDKQPTPSLAPERSAPRSLATPSLPKSAPAPSRTMSRADEAVLAAAQASGAQVGWVDAPEVAEVAPRKRREKRVKPERIKPERVARGGGGFSRAIAGPLVAVTLLLAAGFGLYWVLGMGGETGPAPLLTADVTPTKETPVVEADATEPQQSVVFNEMDGVVPGAEEQLVSRDQADVNEVTQVAATPDVSEEGLANRRVRTVTVRPDGTIVSGEDSVAGSTLLPVDRPNVPAIEGAETASPELLASAAATVTTTTATEPVAATSTLPDTSASAPVAVVTPGATVPAVDSSGNTLAGRTTVIPLQRPSSFARQASASMQPDSIDALVAPTAATSQTAAASTGQPSATVPGATEVEALGNTAPAYVQLASQRTEAEARTTAQGLVTRFGPLFGGANMEVQRVDLGARGIYYRVRVPANSLEQASNICVNVKAAGGDCFTM